MQAWDLGNAMRRKEEFETARLIDFEFRLRARTARRIAIALDVKEELALGWIVDGGHHAFITALAKESGRQPAEIETLWAALEPAARQELIAERGDPSPYRMA